MRQNLEKFYKDPEWVIVEDILNNCLKELATPPNDDTEPADFKAQILANKKLLSAVNNFLSQAKIRTDRGSDYIKSNNPFE